MKRRAGTGGAVRFASPRPPRSAGRRLGRAFFDRPTRQVARDLLGASVWVRGAASEVGVRLVETEAYVANDPANHAFRGATRRNRSMFGKPGTLYVYRIHQVVCANLVTRPGEAVLLRAGEALGTGLPSASGPGRLCRVLGLSLADDGLDTTRAARVRLGPADRRRVKVVRSPRVGISRARELPLRFTLFGDRNVSRPRPWASRRRA